MLAHLAVCHQCSLPALNGVPTTSLDRYLTPEQKEAYVTEAKSSDPMAVIPPQ